MLTFATLGLAAYALFSIAGGVVDLIVLRRLDTLADLFAVLLGLILLLAAALVRTRIPGGLALAIGALLGLQAVSLQNAAHLYGFVAPGPQFARAAFAASMIGIAWRAAQDSERRD